MPSTKIAAATRNGDDFRLFDKTSDTILRTRDLCTLGLGLGCILSLTLILTGSLIINAKGVKAPVNLTRLEFMSNFYSHFYRPGDSIPTFQRICQLPKGISVLLTLLLNLLVTAVLDSINYIQAMTLRWTLFHENRMKFNSKIRLLTCSKSNGPNSWYFNIISGIALAISHGAMSSIMRDANIEGRLEKGDFHKVSSSSNFVIFNLIAIIALGVGILIQVCISTYSLLYKGMVLTWSNNLLANATALHQAQGSQVKDSVMLPAIKSQDSMLKVAPQIWVTRYLMWGLCGIFSIWSLGQGIFVHLNDYPMHSKIKWDPSPLRYWKFYGAMWTNFYSISDTDNLTALLGLLVQVILQSFLAFALHCLELLFNLSRDEAVWRNMETVGSSPNPSAISNLSRYGFMLTFIKASIHWIFGYALSADLTFNISLLPIIALAVVFMLLTGYTEYMIRTNPKGSIPTTYGNFQGVLGLVDEWNHPRLFWGDKGELGPGLRRAGTAGEALPDLQSGKLYCCFQGIEYERDKRILNLKEDYISQQDPDLAIEVGIESTSL
ncbi:hypothetical protein N7462_003355 [Penicillium macrosclerotiorum]|uniref:uncharacterized protein n=1 Tax=Penicillium macrosclerotiorum TaxID=303699 RepID=UPI002546E6B2|nr:uncharacterized protein N7462_003355 [Penicillium macrosclerotiorum]KAJ5688963.1 hypothetical protein N7462_003355 [Penicillium macrosclerotiorum]